MAVKTTLDIKLKTDNPVNIGVWQGAKIRSAIIGAVARSWCDNVRYGACDTCNVETCMNKYLFHFKQDKKARMASNPIIIDAPFTEDEQVSDTVSLRIHLFNPATEYLDDLTEILKRGIYLGNPMVKFTAIEINKSETELDFNGLEEPTDSMKNTTVEVTFETPMVTNSLSGVTPQQIIKNCTTRITSMVNTLDIDYEVKYGKVNEAAEKISLIEANIQDTYYGKMSTRTNKFKTIHGYVGTMKLKGDFSDIYRYMQMASELNIGKQCSMGFGKISVKEVKS